MRRRRRSAGRGLRFPEPNPRNLGRPKDAAKTDIEYRSELRANRHRFFDRHFKSRLAEAGLDGELFSSTVLRDIRNLQNRTRGDLFELMGEVVVQQNLETADRPSRQRRLETPFGERRLDLFFEDPKLAVEVKSGYVTNRRSIREQIRKDEHLIAEGTVASVLWLLFRGASGPALRNLQRSGIRTLDLEYDAEQVEDSC